MLLKPVVSVLAAKKIEVSWNKITNEIGRDHQIQIWRKGVESGIYLDKF